MQCKENYSLAEVKKRLRLGSLIGMFNPSPLLIGVQGVRLLREEGTRETPQANFAEEAPGPPAESEHLARRSTGCLMCHPYLQGSLTISMKNLVNRNKEKLM